MTGSRRGIAAALAAVGLVGLVGFKAAEAWWYRGELARAVGLVAAGRFEPAREILAPLAGRWPDQPSAQYHLGLCERSLGRPEAAVEAWEQVAPGASEFAAATVARAQCLVQDLGQYAEAEAALAGALADAGRLDPAARAAIRGALVQVLSFEGRTDEARRLLRDGWAADPGPKDLRALWVLDTDPYPVEAIRDALERAHRVAPNDDRTWLGLAGLAARTADFAAARAWLDRCLDRRPDDPAVWRARLDLALAADDPAEARRALGHLPAAGRDRAEVLGLRAWFAARSGDPQAERAALEALVEAVPGSAAALVRLAAIAQADGRAADAEALRARKAEADRDLEQYRRRLADGTASAGEFEPLARLAEALGRRFEARGWWTLALRRKPGLPGAEEAIARLDPAADLEPVPPGAVTLADLVRPAETVTATVAEPEPAADALRFEDDAEAAGLAFRHESGRSARRQLPETMSGGVALLDYDADGWLDVYCVQGGAFPPGPGPVPQRDRLYRNNGDGTFADATETSGLAALPGGYGHGAAVGDVDDDGFPDLLVTRWRSYALYRNNGDGTFSDATDAWGLAGDRDWPTSAAFADLDADGDLDLYVCHYLAWDPDKPQLCRRGDGSPQYCDPRLFPAIPDRLYRNDGGRFADVSAEAGITAGDADGRGLGVLAADLDADGRLDLFVANDTTANYLWRNLGGLRFEEVGLASGVAANASGGYQAGMGVACGDLDGDGLPDLAVTNFYGESTTLFQNLGGGIFTDRTAAVGLAAPSRLRLGFGLAFLDADADGRLDLASANGHVNDFAPFLPHAMPAQLLRGGPDGRLTDVTDRAGPPWPVPRLGRGLAAGDLDNDGRVDLVLLAQDAPLACFRNRSDPANRALVLRLEGTASGRDAVGAVATVTAGGQVRTARRVGGGSYQSSPDPRLHIGLGRADRAEAVEVRWPSGRVDRLEDLPAGGHHLREGDPTPRPLPGFAGGR